MINLYYKSVFSYTTNISNLNLSVYVMPMYNKWKGSILSRKRSHVENFLQPITNSWNKKDMTMVSDGWSDLQRRPLINYCYHWE